MKILATIACAALLAGSANCQTKFADSKPVPPVNLDEVSLLIHACGRPSEDLSKSAARYAGPHAVERHLFYGHLEFEFLHAQGEATWAKIGTFHVHENDTVDADVAAKEMPCLRKVKFFFDPK